jgi:ankyrin repeat protein
LPASSAATQKTRNVPQYQSSFDDIFEAAHQGTVEDVRFFVETKRISVNAKNDGGMTVLHYAILNVASLKDMGIYKESDGKIVKYLVSKGADVNAKNDLGYTPRDFAKKNGVEHLLVSSGDIYIGLGCLALLVIPVLFLFCNHIDSVNKFNENVQQKSQESQQRRIAEAEQQLAEENQRNEVAKQFEEKRAAGVPLDINQAIEVSGFHNKFLNLHLHYWLQYGNANLKNRLEQAKSDLRKADAFDKPKVQAEVNQIEAEITAAQNAFAKDAYFGEYSYSTRDVKVNGNESSCIMRIDTGIGNTNVANVSFPLPKIVGRTADARGRRNVYGHIEVQISGDTASVQELVRNNNLYSARVHFNNLRYNHGSKPTGNVLSIEVIKK